MITDVRLPLSDAALILNLPGGWCTVELEARGRRFPLGSDDYTVIRRQILSHMAREGKVAAGVVDRQPVYWVLSLFELHYTLYAQFGPDGRRLLIQRLDCDWLWCGELSDQNWQAWQVALDSEITPDQIAGQGALP